MGQTFLSAFNREASDKKMRVLIMMPYSVWVQIQKPFPPDGDRAPPLPPPPIHESGFHPRMTRTLYDTPGDRKVLMCEKSGIIMSLSHLPPYIQHIPSPLLLSSPRDNKNCKYLTLHPCCPPPPLPRCSVSPPPWQATPP